MKRLIKCYVVLLVFLLEFTSISGCIFSKKVADEYCDASNEENSNVHTDRDDLVRQKCSKDEIVEYYNENRTRFNDLFDLFVSQNWTSVYIAEEIGIIIDYCLATGEEQAIIEECLKGWHIFDVFSSIYYQCQEGIMFRFEFKCGVSQGICVDLTKFAPLYFEEVIDDNWYYYDYPVH